MQREPKYQVGQKFKTRGKFPRECTVIDIYKTYNLKGEMIELRYIATHEMMGQIVTGEYPETTIDMGKI